MTDNECIARAMGWDLDDGGDALDRLAGEIPATWVNHERNEYRNDLPDYFTDPALLGEMLNWLRQRYAVGIDAAKIHGPWIVSVQVRVGHVRYEKDRALQAAIARCVCWALEREQSE